MAKKKAELADDAARYDDCLAAARAAEADGLYGLALRHAEAAWDYVDGMIQYGRRFEELEFHSVAAIELVLRYASLLFDTSRLDRLAGLLKKEKRITKHVSVDLLTKLEAARANVWANHRLFSFLEDHPETRQDELRQQLGGDQEYWRKTVEAWAAMGLVSRTPERNSYRLRLVTRLGQVMRAKCPKCGDVAEAPKAMFLEQVTCTSCRSSRLFVLLPDKAGA